MDRRAPRRRRASARPFTAAPRHLLGADPRAGRRASARRRPAGRRADEPALPRLPHRGADRRQAATCSPTTGSTSTTRACKVGRIQNFQSWSPEMVPDPTLACLGLEYFCFEGDGLWNASDAELIALGQEGARQDRPGRPRTTSWTAASCASRRPIRSTTTSYTGHVETIRAELAEQLPDPAPGRPQRHAQVQQPGPRHDDGHADRQEHPGRRDASTTSGTSTRTPSTTRPARPASARRSASVRLVPARVGAR